MQSTKGKKVRRTETIGLVGNYILHFSGNKRVYLKVKQLSYAQKIDHSGIVREKTCMEVLRGLAIPDLVALSRNQLPRVFRGVKGLTFAAQSEEGKQLDHVGLTPRALLGAWLFVTEQLVAFRRHQILYTDIKCSNILATKDPLKITIIDFDHAIPIVDGPLDLDGIGITPRFAPPEIYRDTPLSEQSVVFQLGMLLAHVLTKLTNRTLHDPARGLSKVVRILHRLGAADIAELVASCLDSDPKNRPKNYEAVLRQVNATEIPEQVLMVWERLRIPYKEKLEEVGLGSR